MTAETVDSNYSNADELDLENIRFVQRISSTYSNILNNCILDYK